MNDNTSKSLIWLQKVKSKKLENLMLIVDVFNGKIRERNFKKGYRSLDDLWFKANLTTNQRKGIIWSEHIKKRILYKEMLVINYYIHNVYFAINLAIMAILL